MWLTLLSVVFYVQCVAALSLGTSDIGAKYTTLRRSVVNQKYQLTSLVPAGYLSRLPRAGTKREEVVRIKEIVYVPSLLSAAPEDNVANVEDDEHWLSLLCEKGYKVHVLTNCDCNTDVVEAVQSIIASMVKARVPARSIAVCANELACPSVLRYLSVALQMGPARADIGACVLIQPPPLQAIASNAGRTRLLQQRYLHLSEDELGPTIYQLLRRQSGGSHGDGHGHGDEKQDEKQEEEEKEEEEERRSGRRRSQVHHPHPYPLPYPYSHSSHLSRY